MPLEPMQHRDVWVSSSETHQFFIQTSGPSLSLVALSAAPHFSETAALRAEVGHVLLVHDTLIEEMMTGLFLQQGDEGASVSALELAPAALGFEVGGVDGVFSQRTVAAVSRPQENQAIAATGTIDDDTGVALAGEAFSPSERTQISAEEFPSIARPIFFANEVDDYL